MMGCARKPNKGSIPDAPPGLFAAMPRECGLDQANGITLPPPCRFNNPLGDDVEHHFRLVYVVECLVGNVKSLDHGCKRLGVKLPRRYQGTDWHCCYPPW
jgi:hypothetical protein